MPKLTIDIEARLAQFQDSLDRVGRDTARGVARLDGVIKGLAGTLALLGTGAAFAGLSGFVRNAIDAADGFGKLSQRVGVTVERLSELAVAARVSDVSQEQLQQGLVRLAANADDAARGVGEAKDAFAALGISLIDSQGRLRGTDQLFTEIANKLAGFEDSAQKTALAVSLLGRSGANLLPLINSLSETEKLAGELGATIDTKTAKAAERFNDNLELVRVAVEATGQRIAAQLLPTLEGLSERLLNFAKDSGRVAEAAKVIDTALKLLASGATVVAEAFALLGTNLGAGIAAFEQFARGNFRAGLDLIAQGSVDALDRLAAIPGKVGEIWTAAADDVDAKSEATSDKLAAPVLKAAKKTRKGVDDIARAAGRLAAFELQVQTEANEAFNQTQVKRAQLLEEQARIEEQARLRSVALYREEIAELQKVDNAAEGLNRTFDDLGLAISSRAAQAVQDWSSAGNILRGIVQDVGAVIINELVTKPLAAAASSGLSKIFAGLFSPVTSSTPLASAAAASGIISPFAEGGIVNRPTIGLVGEAGPEAVVPLKNGRVPVEGGGGITVVQYNTFQGGADAATMAAWSEQVRRAVLGDVRNEASRAGPLARMLGAVT